MHRIASFGFREMLNYAWVGENNIAGSRRPSILPVPDMFTSSSFSISGNDDGEEADESEDEIDDDVPWRSPSEKIA